MGDSFLKTKLQQLGLSANEVLIFLTLLQGPKTPAEIARVTGIARSNVYRVVNELVDKSLIRQESTENGQTLAAADPATLELLVIEKESEASAKREELNQLLPMLTGMTRNENDFSIRSYRGLSGVKQMLWNELKDGEILVFCSGSLDNATGRRWAEKYRSEIIERGISQRAIENPRATKVPLSHHPNYSRHYTVRFIPTEILAIQPEISIHGNTISIYNSWAHDIELGTEITNPFLASFMRQLFEHYWELATPAS